MRSRRAVEGQMVLWWIPPDPLPAAADGLARLAHIREH
jgi:hypothetical protein